MAHLQDASSIASWILSHSVLLSCHFLSKSLHFLSCSLNSFVAFSHSSFASRRSSSRPPWPPPPFPPPPGFPQMVAVMRLTYVSTLSLPRFVTICLFAFWSPVFLEISEYGLHFNSFTFFLSF